MISPEDFVHLHVHSDNSLLDGACTVKGLVDKAVRNKHKALALTDHGTVSGVYDFYNTAKAAGIKPIIGCEANIFDGEIDTKIRGYNHITLLAQNETGWKNLSKISTAGYLEGFYYKPRVNWKILEDHSEGIICLSGCLKGAIAEPIAQGKPKKALEIAGRMHDIFRDRLFLEIQTNHIEQQFKLNDACIRLSRKLGIPLAVACDVHYLNPEDAVIQDIKICIASNKPLNAGENKVAHEGLYYRSTEEIYRLFNHLPQAITNTRRIADMINFDFKSGIYHLPKFDCPDGLSQEEYFEKLSRQGLQNKYGDALGNEHRERLEYEMEVIKKSGYAAYFLVVADFIRWAKENDIPVGPGRGSGAGSIVAYSLQITDVDPLRYGLLFERFLNPDRVSMPDIDIDFCEDRRKEVIEYVKQKYGEECVSQISTFGTLKAKNSVRDVCRVMSISTDETNTIAKSIPTGPKVELKHYKGTDAFKKIIEPNKKYSEMFSYAERVEGMKRHAGIHAAAVVIGDTDLRERIPLTKVGSKSEEGGNKEKHVATQFTMNEVEAVGLLKMDFLGLRNLTVIHKAEKLISQKLGRPFSVKKEANLDDKATYDLISSGKTLAVFQLEKKGFQQLLTQAQPSCFEDIAALVALYRPGPLGSDMHILYCDRKHGLEKITYLHPSLEPILKDTYGCLIYQEQVMRISVDCAGFTRGESDKLRKAVGKKIASLMESIKPKFINGCQKNAKMSSAVANELWDQIEKFSEYAFNKSHSVAYGMITFYTAWLKTHHPTEYMGAVLTSFANKKIEEFVPYINECYRLKIEILPPDIHKSQFDFSIIDGKVIYGFHSLKNVGDVAAKEILKARKRVGKFKSFFHFHESIDSSKVTAKNVEVLIKSGALEEFGHRAQLLVALEEALEVGKGKKKKKYNPNQGGLFDAVEQEMIEELDSERMPTVTAFTPEQIQEIELEILGFYLSSHPLDAYRDIMDELISHDSNAVATADDGEGAIVGGIVEAIKIVVQRNNGKRMAFLSLRDLVGPVEAIAFGNVYQHWDGKIQKGHKLFVIGKTQSKNSMMSVVADEIVTFEDAKEQFSSLLKKKPSEDFKTARNDFENLPELPDEKEECNSDSNAEEIIEDRESKPAQSESKTERKEPEPEPEPEPARSVQKAEQEPSPPTVQKVSFAALKEQALKANPELYLVSFELSVKQTTPAIIDDIKKIFDKYPGDDKVRYSWKEARDYVYEMEETVYASKPFEDELFSLLGEKGNIKVKRLN